MLHQHFLKGIKDLEKQIDECRARESKRMLRRKLSAYSKQRGICYFCKCEMYACTLTCPKDQMSRCASIEHIECKAFGGGNSKDNIAATCIRCNNNRRTMDFDAFVYLCDSVEYEELPRFSRVFHSKNIITLNQVVEYLFTKFKYGEMKNV